MEPVTLAAADPVATQVGEPGHLFTTFLKKFVEFVSFIPVINAS